MSESTNTVNNPKVSIGMPVYNGERFLRNRLDSILSQTFTNFELIISDNASTDSTASICKEYSNKDKRIRFILQEKNMGALWNFDFVLQDAKCKYFVWAAVDDIWTPDFLEKNVSILDSNKNVVGSIGNVEYYEENKEYKINLSKSKLKNFLKYRHTKPPKYQHVHPVSGEYEKKAGFYLRFDQASAIYGVYRTDKLQKSMIKKLISSWDLLVILSVLRFGDLHVIDEVLFYKYAKGEFISGLSFIEVMRKTQFSWIEIIFFYFPFTFWCIKNIGIKFFFKNIDWFIALNLYGEYVVASDLIQKYKLKISK